MTYIVKPGDTLYGIYGPNWRQLSGYNGDPTKLQIGTALPGPSQPVPQQPQSQIRIPTPQTVTSAQTGQQPQQAMGGPQQPQIPQAVATPFQSPTNMPDGKTITPAEIGNTVSSVSSNATPPGVGDSELWKKVVKGAQLAQAKYGIPASLTLAQFFQETGGGAHFVGNNLFGIKGSGNDGSTKALTWEQGPNGPYQTYANFRAYKSVEDSIVDHARLLAEDPNYQKVQGLVANGDQNPDSYAEALNGIYATDPNYSSALKSLVRQHNLVQYDNVNKTASPVKAGSQTGTPDIPSTLTPDKSQSATPSPDIAKSSLNFASPLPTFDNSQTPSIPKWVPDFIGGNNAN